MHVEFVLVGEVAIALAAGVAVAVNDSYRTTVDTISASRAAIAFRPLVAAESAATLVFMAFAAHSSHLPSIFELRFAVIRVQVRCNL